MTVNTKTVEIRKLTADEGMVITDAETETLRATTVYLSAESAESDFKEIPEDTPLPEIESEDA